MRFFGQAGPVPDPRPRTYLGFRRLELQAQLDVILPTLVKLLRRSQLLALAALEQHWIGNATEWATVGPTTGTLVSSPHLLRISVPTTPKFYQTGRVIVLVCRSKRSEGAILTYESFSFVDRALHWTYDSLQATKLCFTALTPRRTASYRYFPRSIGWRSYEGFEYSLTKTTPLLDHELPRKVVRTTSQSSCLNDCALNHL